jgi:hypothetical protein
VTRGPFGHKVCRLLSPPAGGRAERPHLDVPHVAGRRGAGRRGSRTDRDRLRAVIGEDNFRFFYTKDPVIGESRRNALAHGRLIDETGLVRRIAELQDRLLGEVRNNVGGTGPLAFSPVRGFRTFEPFAMFLEPLSALPSLPSLTATAFDHGFHSASDPKWVGVAVNRRLIAPGSRPGR